MTSNFFHLNETVEWARTRAPASGRSLVSRFEDICFTIDVKLFWIWPYTWEQTRWSSLAAYQYCSVQNQDGKSPQTGVSTFKGPWKVGTVQTITEPCETSQVSCSKIQILCSAAETMEVLERCRTVQLKYVLQLLQFFQNFWPTMVVIFVNVQCFQCRN